MANAEEKANEGGNKGGIEIRAFRGFVPSAQDMGLVQCPPYDVIDSQEALDIVNDIKDVKAKDKCFLHVNKPEIDVPECLDNIDNDKVYLKGKENLDSFVKKGYLIESNDKELYIYGQEWLNHKQYGIVCEVSALQYKQGLIKKHELTRKKKEDDRTKLTKTQRANVGPVFLCYKDNENINNIIKNGNNSIINNTKPYSIWHTSISNKFLVISDNELNELKKENNNEKLQDVVTHKLWRINDEKEISRLIELFEKQVPCLYVADGHHRTKAAYNVYRDGDSKKDSGICHFMAVLFPANELKILDYNRVVRFGHGNLKSMTNETFLKALDDSKAWEYSKIENEKDLPKSAKNEFRMYLGGNDKYSGWYLLKINKSVLDSIDKNAVVKLMDCSLLSDYLLSPILDIKDIRQSEDIDFVGGIHGISKLKDKLNTKWGNNNGVAFALYPTSVDELMSVADANKILPPKSTWFEPKLRSGVVVRRF